MAQDHPTITPLPGAPALEDAPEDAETPQGRIGYGRWGRFSPLVLGALLLLVVAGIWWTQRESGSETPRLRAVGQPAPDVSLRLLDGDRLSLADLRGNVVVLNFWASWCAPCRTEMPELQAFWDEARQQGEKTVVVGVGVRTDVDAKARAFVAEGGFTYPIGRDNDTDQPGLGPIETAFGIPEAYPATVVIRPDGVIDRYQLGPVTGELLRQMVDQARQDGG